jgi:hypothetical protein
MLKHHLSLKFSDGIIGDTRLSGKTVKALGVLLY